LEVRLEVEGMNYREVTEWLFGLRRSGRERELRSIRRLLSQIGDPQKRLRSIHVAGTNGKGSTTAMIASILSAAGYRVGMFTSPHLSRFTERIVIDGREIPEEEVVRITKELKPIVDQLSKAAESAHLTFFEVSTSIAFRYFAECEVDFAVLEVGMGGRLDATNVTNSLVSVITNISMEHSQELGETKLKIAREKAGIIKNGGVLITATEDNDVFVLFKEICEQTNSRIFRVGSDIKARKLSSSLKGQYFQLDGLVNRFERLFIPLLGDHQLLNAASAVGAVEALSLHGMPITAKAVQEGLKQVKWPGRLEIMQKHPLVVLDCAKDIEAARALKESLLKDFKYRRLIALVSISSDKNIPVMIDQLAQAVDRFVITSHGVMGRAADLSRIAKEVERNHKPYELAADVNSAVQKAMELADNSDMICVTGSIFLVGEARELWAKSRPDARCQLQRGRVRAKQNPRIS